MSDVKSVPDLLFDCSWVDAFQTRHGTISTLFRFATRSERKAKPLYVDKPGNALMNDFGIYLMDQLCTFQCIGSLKIKEHKDIFQFLDESYPEIGSNGRA